MICPCPFPHKVKVKFFEPFNVCLEDYFDL
jgi:hypothetical protein